MFCLSRTCSSLITFAVAKNVNVVGPHSAFEGLGSYLVCFRFCQSLNLLQFFIHQSFVQNIIYTVFVVIALSDLVAVGSVYE